MATTDAYDFGAFPLGERRGGRAMVVARWNILDAARF
jgi:hypothetical protein